VAPQSDPRIHGQGSSRVRRGRDAIKSVVGGRTFAPQPDPWIYAATPPRAAGGAGRSLPSPDCQTAPW
jgi:hypothetical protein